ncbi:MAG TPA: energy transducer TonB [Gemmatimonadales bacterium]|nr:energy transducer TonB [Gemmatimonadales bacterium]
MRTLRISIATLLLASSASAQRATLPATTDPWEVTELTNRPSLTLELPALTTVRAARAAAFEVRPVLLVRCQDRELDVFVATGSVLDSDDNVRTPVRIQWGSEPPTDSRWSRSTDSTSAFAPDPRALLRQLASHPDLRLEIRPSGKSAQLIRFNARGLERHMAQVDAACPPGGNGDGPAADQVYADGAVDERAEIVSAPPLDYPPALRQAGLQGRVTVQAVIDTLGRAEPASLKVITHPNTAFDQSARAYVLHVVFRPARVKGRTVRVLIRVPVDYRIE